MAAVLAAGKRQHARILPDQPGLVGLLSVTRALFVEALRVTAVRSPILSDMQGLTDYLIATMAFERHERVRVLFLDGGNMLLRDEIVAVGDALSATIHPREIMRRALELGATALVLVHNHPSGNPTPSRSDLAVTKSIVDAAAALGIVVHDHLIIGRGAWVSMRARGMM